MPNDKKTKTDYKRTLIDQREGFRREVRSIVLLRQKMVQLCQARPQEGRVPQVVADPVGDFLGKREIRAHGPWLWRLWGRGVRRCRHAFEKVARHVERVLPGV